MDIVTGYTGTPHITAQQDRYINEGIFGLEGYILPVGEQLAAVQASATTVTIKDGVFVMNGCVGVIARGATETLTVTNSFTDYNKNDLIVVEYDKAQDGTESLSLAVMEGDRYSPSEGVGVPSHDPYYGGDRYIETGWNVIKRPLYRVCFEGATLSSIVPLATVLPTLSDFVTEQLTVSYVSNSYCESGDIDRLHAYKRGGMLFLNGNLNFSATVPTGTAESKIATISNWNACSTVYQTVPAMDGSGAVGIVIYSTGGVYITNTSGESATGYHRFSVCVPVAE